MHVIQVKYVWTYISVLRFFRMKDAPYESHISVRCCTRRSLKTESAAYIAEWKLLISPQHHQLLKQSLSALVLRSHLQPQGFSYPLLRWGFRFIVWHYSSGIYGYMNPIGISQSWCFLVLWVADDSSVLENYINGQFTTQKYLKLHPNCRVNFAAI